MPKVMDDIISDEDEVDVSKKKDNKKIFGEKTIRKPRIG